MAGYDLRALAENARYAGHFALSTRHAQRVGHSHGVNAGTVADLVCTGGSQSPPLMLPAEAGPSDTSSVDKDFIALVTRAKAAREPKALTEMQLRAAPLNAQEREVYENLVAKRKVGDRLTPVEAARFSVYSARVRGERHHQRTGQYLTPGQVAKHADLIVKTRAVISAQDKVAELLSVPGAVMPTNRDATTWLSGGAMCVQFSGNEKIKDAVGDSAHGSRNTSTTYAAINPSCPLTCVQRGVSCYAETSNNIRPIVLMLEHIARVLGHDGEAVAEDEARAIDASFTGGVRIPTDLRIHTVGDCQTSLSAQTVAAAASRWLDRARAWTSNPKYHGLKASQVWSYTHAFRSHSRADWGVVSTLASVSGPKDIEFAISHGWAPTAVVAPKYFHKPRLDKASGKMVPYFTEEGMPIPFTLEGSGGVQWIPCPAQNPDEDKRVGCVSCRICFNDQKLRQLGQGVAFQAHASGKVQGVPFNTAEFQVDYAKGLDARRAGKETQSLREAAKSQMLDTRSRVPAIHRNRAAAEAARKSK